MGRVHENIFVVTYKLKYIYIYIYIYTHILFKIPLNISFNILVLLERKTRKYI
jgi:hypothetical protein